MMNTLDNEPLPLSLIVPSEEFELKEILIRSDIDRDVFQHFSEDTVKSIQEEVGLSAGLLPKLTEDKIQKIERGAVIEIEKWDDIPKTNDPRFGEYFADVYLNGAYKWEAGEVVYKKNGIKDREKILNLEGLSREFLIHPESIVQLRRKLKLIRKSDRQEESLRHLGFAVGVLMGRFDAQTGGLLDLAEEKRKEKGIQKDPKAPKALEAGMYFTPMGNLRNTLDGISNLADDVIIQKLKEVLIYKLGENKAGEIWKEMEIALVWDTEEDRSKQKKSWVEFFRESFFSFHLSKYENRPIYFPLSSAKKSFVFYINIHTWKEGTFSYILSEFINPDLKVMKARMVSLEESKLKADKSELGKLDKEMAQFDKWIKELEEFQKNLEIINLYGIDSDLLEEKASYFMDLDDGVLVNSSALHPLLSPQGWKVPKEIWGKILKPEGKKDYDWSHLAMRYFPKRVYEKCKKDPSLAVAHSDYGKFKGSDLFKELHPDAFEKWEERNNPKPAKKDQDKIPGFENIPEGKKVSKKKSKKKKV